MNVFEVPRRIRFSDCDPAGIVFYPQYFVMLNGLMEDWVDALGIGFADLVSRRRIGLPTVRLEADFRTVSRFGDDVVLSLQVERLGGRALAGARRGRDAAGGVLRMEMRQVVVTTSLESHKAIDVPADLRDAILRQSG